MPLIEHVREPVAAAVMLYFLLPKLNILEVVIALISSSLGNPKWT